MASWAPKTDLAKAVVKAGFLYDKSQDIIYSRMYAQQHHLGYCWAYDESSALSQMIIDCETFYFVHEGEVWLIELWKGQYGLETGCEIGVYRDGPVLGPFRPDPLHFRSRFFRCVERNTKQMLYMRSALYRNGKKLFHRGPEYHWWLTGFRWGIFTEHTHHLAMRVQIDFPSVEMCLAFKIAADLKRYNLTEITKKSVAFTFQYPKTRQPASRVRLEAQMQARNKLLVEGYKYYKREMHITDNDPNSFAFSPYEVPAEQLASSAAAEVRKVAEAGSKAVRHEAAHIVKPTHHQVAHIAAASHHEVTHIADTPHGAESEEAMAAYNKVFAFFDKKVWHTTSHPQDIV